MIRLVGDVAASQEGILEKRRILMDGLVKMVAAHRWWWSVSEKRDPNGRPNHTAVSHGGFENGLFAKLLAAIDDSGSWPIFTHFSKEMEESGQHLTRTRSQMDLDDQFSVPRTNALWAEAGVTDLILSVCPLDKGDFSAVAIYRGHDSARFTPREAHIVHMVLTGVEWIHALSLSDDRKAVLSKLSPRRRMVLNLVLEGQSRKEMAASLKISVHTLDGYVKDIFKLFDVHSQAELIARFRSGEGAGTPESGD